MAVEDGDEGARKRKAAGECEAFDMFPAQESPIRVGGITPGTPKACQTGWFETSRYRFNFLTGTQR
jgi:hypothetical protein